MLTFVARIHPPILVEPQHRLALQAEERCRSHHQFVSEEGKLLRLRLQRGTILQDGDILRTDDSSATPTYVRVIAKPEPVITVTAEDPQALLRAAYHLGNRHVPVEINIDYLRFSPDSVLEAMLMQMPVQLCHEVLPFFPESGAYATHLH
jgi:urease accessory protein